MKIKLFYFFILFLLTIKMVGQTVSDTVFIYDTIIVYETKIVYDTIKVVDGKQLGSEYPEKIFKNNNTIQNAVLAVDTATSKAELILFNKNDTATISINSIIVTENLNHTDTMKKKILTLAAAGLLTQTNFAQEDQIAFTNSSTKAENTVQSETQQNDSAIAAANQSSISENKTKAYSIETIVFQNRKKPQKTYEVTLPATHGIRFKSWKTRAALNGSSSIIYTDRLRSGIITHIDDSIVTVKYKQKMNTKAQREYYKKLRKLKEDKVLSTEEKEIKYFELTYTDSANIPVKLIKNIKFTKFNSKNKWFYNSSFGFGFNESIKYGRAHSAMEILPSAALAIMFWTTTPLVISGITNPIIVVGAIMSYYLIAENLMLKKINFNRWQFITK